MNLLCYFDEVRSSASKSALGRIRKVAGQVGFAIVGSAAALVVLTIVLVMRVCGRDRSRR